MADAGTPNLKSFSDENGADASASAETPPADPAATGDAAAKAAHEKEALARATSALGEED